MFPGGPPSKIMRVDARAFSLLGEKKPRRFCSFWSFAKTRISHLSARCNLNPKGRPCGRCTRLADILQPVQQHTVRVAQHPEGFAQCAGAGAKAAAHPSPRSAA